MGDERYLIAVNFSDIRSQAIDPDDLRKICEEEPGGLSELLSVESYERGGDEVAESGLFVSLATTASADAPLGSALSGIGHGPEHEAAVIDGIVLAGQYSVQIALASILGDLDLQPLASALFSAVLALLLAVGFATFSSSHATTQW